MAGYRSVRTVQTRLREIGWPVTIDGIRGPQTREAIADFQRGWTYSKLPIDSAASYASRTYWAIRDSAKNNGRCSDHFRFAEWKSHGNGWIKVHRALVKGLEVLRKEQGPIYIVSGYRDPQHNADVGGASNSQHKYGNAADFAPVLSIARVRALGVFSGIGYDRSTSKVRHVDVRHEGPNTTGGTKGNPTIWQYPS